MKTLIISLAVLLTGCASLDHMVCYGTGTCGRSIDSKIVSSGRYVSPTPQTIITNQGTYIIVRDQSSGAISSIISTSGGK